MNAFFILIFKKAVRDCEANNPQVKYWANKLIELENKRTRVAEDAKKQSALFGFKVDDYFFDFIPKANKDIYGDEKDIKKFLLYDNFF